MISAIRAVLFEATLIKLISACWLLFMLELPDQLSPSNTQRIANYAMADAVWYTSIAQRGYEYDPGARSSVAFFPLYPVLGKIVSVTVGGDTNLALFIISFIASYTGILFLLAYVRCRWPEASKWQLYFVGFAYALYPANFFMQMQYSESLCFSLTLLVFLAMHLGVRPVICAILIGTVAATRPLGVLLTIPFLINVYRTQSNERDFVKQALRCLPLCFWGLLAYMTYLWIAFGNPIAFAQTQEHWRFLPKVSFSKQLTTLATFEPFWGVWDQRSEFYQASRVYQRGMGWLSANFYDRFVWLLSAILLGIGAYKKWLNAQEISFAFALILCSYLLRGYEMAFASQGRFSSSAFPIYLSFGALLTRLPKWFSITVLVISGLLMAIYGSGFASGMSFI